MTQRSNTTINKTFVYYYNRLYSLYNRLNESEFQILKCKGERGSWGETLHAVTIFIVQSQVGAISPFTGSHSPGHEIGPINRSAF